MRTGKEGYNVPSFQIQKYTSCFLPNGNIFLVYLHKFYVLLTKLEIKKYFHIWSGPNRVFWKAKDYGFLSVKKVKTQFLAKWRNEDWRFLQFFDHMKTEYCRLSTLLLDMTKIIKN